MGNSMMLSMSVMQTCEKVLNQINCESDRKKKEHKSIEKFNFSVFWSESHIYFKSWKFGQYRQTVLIFTMLAVVLYHLLYVVNLSTIHSSNRFGIQNKAPMDYML